MDKTEAIKNLQYINNQIPNPYFKNTWYDVIMPDGRPAQAIRTKPGFLRVRRMTNHVLKTPEGEILSQHEEWSYFRANYLTGKIELL
jgi:hypothetical protein